MLAISASVAPTRARRVTAVPRRSWLQRRIERRLQRCPDEDHHRLAALGLPQPDVLAVVGRPGQPQEIALPLPGPEREQ